MGYNFPSRIMNVIIRFLSIDTTQDLELDKFTNEDSVRFLFCPNKGLVYDLRIASTYSYWAQKSDGSINDVDGYEIKKLYTSRNFDQMVHRYFSFLKVRLYVFSHDYNIDGLEWSWYFLIFGTKISDWLLLPHFSLFF